MSLSVFTYSKNNNLIVNLEEKLFQNLRLQ